VFTAEMTSPKPFPGLPTTGRKPELLAPAGDRTCLLAALENGADAVYFGLQGHNARARAANFCLDELPGVIDHLHRVGARGYVALNTLVFPAELGSVEAMVRRVVAAGVDAVIVQDLGLCRLIRAVSPDLEIHASTQMSITSVEGVRLARELGCSRVILARELSLRDIAQIRQEAELPVEVFVHGALCVAYSGQCLTSEALGGRSANRGECAQACRMPYRIVCDGRDVDLGDVQYLLSPQDLAAFDLVPKLVELGVASLKIEGRLKTPEYVANITASYRRAIDAACAGLPSTFSPREIQDMEMSFSRGFSHGFLDGNNHKVLVRGDYAKKRGIALGRIEAVVDGRVRIDLAAPVKPGDGLVFDGDEAHGIPEQGGRVYEVLRPGRHEAAPGADTESPAIAGGPALLGFGRDDVDLRRLRPGQRAWKTDDPELTRRLRASFQGPAQRRVAIDVTIHAEAGAALRIEAITGAGAVARVESAGPLNRAERCPASGEELYTQFNRLGETCYTLRHFAAHIAGGPLVPRSVLNALRRDLVARLDEATARRPARSLAAESALPALTAAFSAQHELEDDPGIPSLSALCRTPEQALTAAGAGVTTLYLDFAEIKQSASAITELRDAAPSCRVFLATPRIEKPGEANLFRYLARQGADGLLVRNAGGLLFCAEQGIPFIADFSLNAANQLTVDLLRARGAIRITASYDLSIDQLDDLLRAAPAGRIEIVLHQHMPMFHMEHCVYCAFLSPGTDKTNCGRPCDDHDVKLRDRVGMEHPLKVDVGCRNTLFNAVPQTAAEFLPRLLALGACHFRVEFLDDPPEAVRRTLSLYSDALTGRRDGRTLWKELRAINRYGVTRGQLAVL
jgi:putative protease